MWSEQAIPSENPLISVNFKLHTSVQNNTAGTEMWCSELGWRPILILAYSDKAGPTCIGWNTNQEAQGLRCGKCVWSAEEEANITIPILAMKENSICLETLLSLICMQKTGWNLQCACVYTEHSVGLKTDKVALPPVASLRKNTGIPVLQPDLKKTSNGNAN